MEQDLQDLREQFIRLEKDVETMSKTVDKFDKLTESINGLTLKVMEFTAKVDMSLEKLSDIDGRLKNHGERIGALENKPGENWSKLTGFVLAGLVAAVFAAVQIFGK